jgi:hypothetical protein
MSLVRKLKPDRNIVGPLIPLTMLPIFGLTTLFFGLPAGLLILSFLICAISLFYLYVFLRTWNYPHLFVFAYANFISFTCYVLRKNILTHNIENKEVELAFLTSFIFFLFVLAYLVFTRKLKWRGREVFELAAEPVEEVSDGYTSRPRPVGKVEYSPQQIRLFTRFCARNLIALPYETSKNITLVLIKMGDEFRQLLGLSGDYQDATWVNFDEHGEVSVHISHKDYLDYRESLSFDQLCTSLGQVFIDFFEVYNKGEGVRVVDRMDDLRISIFS